MTWFSSQGTFRLILVTSAEKIDLANKADASSTSKSDNSPPLTFSLSFLNTSFAQNEASQASPPALLI
jgi:hypothetical protein